MGPAARARIASALVALLLGFVAIPVRAQCPSPDGTSLFGGRGYDGDEPDDFTHYVDEDGDGVCDFTGDADGNGRCDDPGCQALVAWDAAAGVHPSGVYPDCMLALYEEGTERAEFILQVGHAHWEYTHFQTDTRGAPEEKDYLTITQAMRADLESGGLLGEATLESIEQTLRFLNGEPERVDRFLRTNPSGRYWQVDQWIGPGLDAGGGLLPLLTWSERFFVCGDAGGVSDCAQVDGVVGYGGYWSNHMEQLGHQPECGEPLPDDPAPELDAPVDPDGRNRACGILFTQCEVH